MATRGTDDRSLVDAIAYDVTRLHRLWMEVAFPQQLAADHPVTGPWRPSTTGERARYYPWAALGALVVAVGYPLAVIGFATRFYSRKLDRLKAAIGAIGVVLLTAAAWGGLTLLVRLRLSPEAFVAVLAASVVATLSSIVALVFMWLDGRPATVLVAYPAGVTAVFLPPAVAALFSTGVAADVYPVGERVARWLLNDVAPADLAADLKGRYDFDPEKGIAAEGGGILLTLGLAHVLLWFGLAVPTGWGLGLTVTLADLVRPTPDADDGE